MDRVDLKARHDRGHTVVDCAQFGGRAAHIECKYLTGPLLRCHVAAHQDACSGTRLDDADRIFAREFRRNETAIRLHDEQVVAKPLLAERALQMA